jgi:hypothetical protein
MPFLAGDIITAQKLNWLSPTIMGAQCSGTLAGSITNTDVPGCTLTPTTVNAGALLKVTWFAAFYAGVASATNCTVRVLVDGVGSTMLALASADTSTSKQQGGGSWVTTLAASGAHTIKLQATLPVSQTLQTLTSIDIEIIEAF